MSIHERIRQRREARGLSMEALADRVGVAWQTVQQWENGKTAPSRRRLPLVAEALDCTQHWLLFGDVPSPDQLSPEALLLAGRYDSMNERERARLRMMLVLSADAVPDEEVARLLPASPKLLK